MSHHRLEVVRNFRRKPNFLELVRSQKIWFLFDNPPWVASLTLTVLQIIELGLRFPLHKSKFSSESTSFYGLGEAGLLGFFLGNRSSDKLVFTLVRRWSGFWTFGFDRWRVSGAFLTSVTSQRADGEFLYGIRFFAGFSEA